ncbi:MAG: BACON domain-containing carbohydrate-binding protein [Bryobacteraceae bacterium]
MRIEQTCKAEKKSRFGAMARLLAALTLLSAGASAQSFAPVAGLNFAKTFGGANPLPQTVTIASTGAAFNFTRSVTAISGGSWLTVQNQSWNGCSTCPTPQALTAIVNPSAALAAGVYTAQITVTSSPGSTTMVIPVTLTIAAAGSGYFDNLPGQLSFFMKTGGTAPPTQAISVRNAGPGTLNWTLSTTTAHGSGWISASATSGAAPSEVTFTINKASLPGGGNTAGSYIGRLLFQTGSGNVTVPVVVVVGDPAFRQINTLSFTKPFSGANANPQTITVASNGSAFNFTVAKATGIGGDWLTVSNVSWNGCNLCATPQTFRVSINPSAALAAGTYTGQVVVTSQTGTQAMTIPVIMVVAPAGSAYLDNMAGQVSFSMATSGTSIAPQSIQIRNGNAGALSWTGTAVTADGGNWLTVSALSGSAPTTITLGVTVNNLPDAGLLAGTHIALLEFRGNGTRVTVPVAVTVGDNVLSQVNPIAFVKQFGGANPLSQTITFGRTGANLNFTVSTTTATGGSWLSATNVSWNSCNLCGTPQAIRVNIVAAPTLPVGTYTGQVVATAQTGFMSITVPVTLTVTAAGATGFDNTPGEMSFSFKTGGVAPPPQSLQLRNAGSGSINWTLIHYTADGGGWLTPSATSGAAPSTVSVSINKNLLPGAGLVDGVFVGSLTFVTDSGSITVPVSVRVAEDSFQQVNALAFTKLYQGPNPLPQTIVIANNGTNFNFTADAKTANGGTWLSVVNESWNSCNLCGGPQALTVKVTPAVGLAAGTYTGQIVVTSQGGAATLTIPVTLTVAESATPHFDDMPGQLSFLFETSGNAPPAQTFRIRNAGAGSLPWTLESATSDSGNWLTVSAASGAAPSDLTVSINKTNLPGLGLVAGTFTGMITLKSAAGNTTVPIVVSVADSVLRQVNPLHFVMPFGGSNPLKQTVTIATSGAAFNFTKTGYTATGGAWLSVTNDSWNSCNLCGTGEVLTVAVTAPVGLAAGQYTGEVIVTAQNGTQVMTIPVSLTVVAPGGAYFDNTQGQVSFSMVTASGNPASQTVTLRNRGSGSLAWTLTATTADGGNWLTATTTSGTATSTVTIGVNAAALPGLGLIPGLFIGHLHFKSATCETTIPVSVAVAADLINQIPALSFVSGGTSQSFEMTSPGLGINFTMTANTGNGGNWLSVTKAGSCNLCTMPRAITVSVNAAGLGNGTYLGQLIAIAQDGRFASTIPVTLNVSGQGPTIAEVVSGSPQSAAINTTFASPLMVRVKDGGGNVYSGVNVTFTAPASGARGTFPGGVNTATVATNASGIATSPAITANGIAGGYTVTAAALGTSVANFSLTNTALCSYAFNPAAASVAKAGGAGSTSMVAGVGCAWSAVSSQAWLTITSGASGSGPGTVNYTVASNPTTVPRVATITAAGATFTVTQSGTDNVAPIVTGMSPNSGELSSQTFSFTFNDTNGAADLNVMNILMNSAIDGRMGCYLAYVRSANTLFLVNDAGDAGGPFVGSLTFPTTSVIGNSQCTINGAGSSVTQTSTSIILNLNMTFAPGWGGRKIFYLAARDVAEANSDWHAKGVWNVPGLQPSSPNISSFTPARVTGASGVFTATFFDNNGATDLNVLNLLINNFIDGRNACYIAYVRSSNTVLLVNDAGDAGGPFAGALTLNGSGVIGNSQCTINAAGSSVQLLGNQLILTLNMTFNSVTFKGDRIVHAAARDTVENNSGWQAVGTITVP